MKALAVCGYRRLSNKFSWAAVEPICPMIVVSKAILIFGLVFLALSAIAGWQIGSCELANFELHEDLRDLAPQRSAQIGLTSPSSDDEIRSTVVRYAEGHQIYLEPDQVTVLRAGTTEAPVFYLAADYRVRVKLLGYPLTLHFTPSSDKGNTIWPFN